MCIRSHQVIKLVSCIFPSVIFYIDISCDLEAISKIIEVRSSALNPKKYIFEILLRGNEIDNYTESLHVRKVTEEIYAHNRGFSSSSLGRNRDAFNCISLNTMGCDEEIDILESPVNLDNNTIPSPRNTYEPYLNDRENSISGPQGKADLFII